MDFWRHIGSGRLSEMFGESQVETDKFLRSLGFADLPVRSWPPCPTSTVRSCSGTPTVSMPTSPAARTRDQPEYAVLGLQNSGYEIELWDPIHT